MFSPAGIDRLLNSVPISHLSVHSAIPGDNGDNEIGGTTRQAIVVPVAINQVRLWDGAISFTMPADSTVGWVCARNGDEVVAYSALSPDGVEYEVQRIVADGRVRTLDFTPLTGQTVTFTGPVPAELTAGALYYIVGVGVDAGGKWFRVSTTANGSAITLSADFYGAKLQVSLYYPQSFGPAGGKLTIRQFRLQLRTAATVTQPTGYRFLEAFDQFVSLTGTTSSYEISQEVSDPARTTGYRFKTGDEAIAAAYGVTLDPVDGTLQWDTITRPGSTFDVTIEATNDIQVDPGSWLFEENWTDELLRFDDSFVSGVTATQTARGPFYVSWNQAGGDIDTSDCTAFGGGPTGVWATCPAASAQIGTQYTFDVTALVKAIARTNSGDIPNRRFYNVGMRISAGTGNTGTIKFASRKNPNVAYRPKIVITGTAAQTIYAECCTPILINQNASSRPFGYGDTYEAPGVHRVTYVAGSQNLIVWCDLQNLTDPSAITSATLVLTGYPEPVPVTFNADGTVNAPGHNFTANTPILFTGGAVPAGLNTNQQYFVAFTFPQSVVAGQSFKLATTQGGAAYEASSFSADGTITSPDHRLANGNQIKFGGGPLPAQITPGATYFVRNVLPTTGTKQTFQISATATGAIITFTAVGSSSAYAYAGSPPVNALSFPALSPAGTQAYRFRSAAGTMQLHRMEFPLMQESVLNPKVPVLGMAAEKFNDEALGSDANTAINPATGKPRVYFYDRCYDTDWFNKGANVVNGKKIRNVNGNIIVDRTKGWASRSFYADIPDPNWHGPTAAGPDIPSYDGNLVEGNDTKRGFIAREPGHRYVTGKWFGFSDEDWPLTPSSKVVLQAGGIDASGIITIIDPLTRQPKAHNMKPRPATANPGAAGYDTGDWGMPVALKGTWVLPFKWQPDLSAAQYWTKRAYYLDPINATQVVLREKLFGPIITPGVPMTFDNAQIHISNGVDGSGALKGNPESNLPTVTLRESLNVRGRFGNNEGFIQDMQSCKQLIGIDSRYDTCEVNNEKVMGEANSGAIVNGLKGFSFRLHSEHAGGFINMYQWASLTDTPYYIGETHHLYQKGYDQWTAYAYVIDPRHATGYDIFSDYADHANYPPPNTGFGLSGPPSALNHGTLGWLKRNRIYNIEQFCQVNSLEPNPYYDPKHADWAAANLGSAFGRYPWTMMSPLDLPKNAAGVPGLGNWSNGNPCMVGNGGKNHPTQFHSADGRLWISDGGKVNLSTGLFQTPGTSSKIGPFLATNSGVFNMWNAYFLPEFREAMLARMPWRPRYDGIFKVWIEGLEAFNYTGWVGRMAPVCADGITPYGVDSAWLCAQSGGVNRFSGDHAPGAYGAMSHLCIASEQIGPVTQAS